MPSTPLSEQKKNPNLFFFVLHIRSAFEKSVGVCLGQSHQTRVRTRRSTTNSQLLCRPCRSSSCVIITATMKPLAPTSLPSAWPPSLRPSLLPRSVHPPLLPPLLPPSILHAWLHSPPGPALVHSKETAASRLYDASLPKQKAGRFAAIGRAAGGVGTRIGRPRLSLNFDEAITPRQTRISHAI